MISNLNVWGVGFHDISILKQMPNIEVLSLPVNNISSLKYMQGLTRLRELSVRKNNIKHLAEVKYLENLDNLQTLWMDENPCADHPKYRYAIAAMLPRLKKLDNRDITEEERSIARKLDFSTFNPRYKWV